MDFIAAAVTDIGLTKKTNQDSYALRIYNTPIGNIAFAVLCDGMGGLDKGEVASASVVYAFCKWAETRLPVICQEGLSEDAVCAEWTALLANYNQKIQTHAESASSSMGTTATVLLLTESRYFLANIGDTRAYQLAGSLVQLTKDQTLVAYEVESGRLTPQEAEQDPRRSVLLQCIGASDAVSPDMFYGDTQQNAVYLLCTDGFRHEITPDEIFARLRPECMVDADGMQANLQELVDLNKQRQERDNISALAIRTF